VQGLLSIVPGRLLIHSQPLCKFFDSIALFICLQLDSCQ
jgi:hypothetical protein